MTSTRFQIFESLRDAERALILASWRLATARDRDLTEALAIHHARGVVLLRAAAVAINNRETVFEN